MAAILKAVECVQYKGKNPNRVARAPVQNQGPAAVVPKFPVQQVRPAQSHQPAQSAYPPGIGDCRDLVHGVYRCQTQEYPPEAGYSRMLEVKHDDYSGAPAMFFRIRNSGAADVWTASKTGPWRFVGIWKLKNTSAECWTPLDKSQQEREARDNLGTDAWGLCFL